MSSTVSDICADFLVEVGEILDQLGEQMVALERAPADRECLNAVFRGFHTIKGGAGFLDFTTMVAVCHAVEDRLNAARDGSAPLDAAAFDGVQQGIDLLVDMLHCISGGVEPEPAPEALLAALRAGAATAPAAAAPVVDIVAPAAGDSDSLDDLDFEALLDSLHGAGGVPGEQPAPAPAAPPP
ncbi:Hpt domain-containing protein, partial [Luteimonas sp. SDU101]|uniref:Hpt domain-containing protein n=1 Tax=Luteimonas sp. SDU101 TaxID=3422593 RepID=UPI003EC055EC